MLRRKQCTLMEHICDRNYTLKRQTNSQTRQSRYSVTYAAIFFRGRQVSRLHTNTPPPPHLHGFRPSIHAEVNALKELPTLNIEPSRCALLILRKTPGGNTANAECCVHCSLIIRQSRIGIVGFSRQDSQWQRQSGATMLGVHESYGWKKYREERIRLK